MNIRQLTASDLPVLNEFWKEHWGGREMVVHGDIFRTSQLEGFAAEDGNRWVGLVTYVISQSECEIISLNTLEEGKGIGTRLTQRVIDVARAHPCRRLFLSTTNDNLLALGFYQRRGFELASIRRGAVNETRKIKPDIPLIGFQNIPIRDEIELEILL